MTGERDATGPPTAMQDGVTPEDLAEVRRELFFAALAVARQDHDPSRGWEAFAEAAWREAALAFGFVEREPWPEGLPRPRLTDDRAHDSGGLW